MYQAHIQLNSLHERQSRPQTHLCQEGQPRHLPSVSQLSLVLFLGCLSRDKPITHCFPLPGNGESGTLHNTRFSRKALLYKISPKFQRVLSQHARVACTQMHVLKLIHSIITTRSSLWWHFVSSHRKIKSMPKGSFHKHKHSSIKGDLKLYMLGHLPELYWPRASSTTKNWALNITSAL